MTVSDDGGPPPILVAVDFSDPSKKAMKAAIELANDMDTSIVLVHAITDVDAPILMGGKMSQDILKEAQSSVSLEEAMTLHEEWASIVSEEGVEVHSHAEEGEPVDVIINQAEEHNAGMIVVGTHGWTGLKRMLIGSVAEDVVRRSLIPVLVVPTRKLK